MNKIDINIVEIHKQEFKNLQASQLVLGISGNSVNCSLINTLRRLIYDYIPTYAFNRENITIEKNTSVFNNDEIKLKLSTITIPKIINSIYYLDDEYWLNVDYRDPQRKKHPDDKKIIEMYINATNDTDEIMNVTSEIAKVYEDSQEVEKFDPNFPNLIIQLRPKQSFSCRCVCSLGVGKNNTIWYGAGNCFYTESNENDFKLTIESQGQYDEYELLHKSCRILKEKIKIHKKLIEDNYRSYKSIETDTLKIVLENEDHTLGGIINEYLQENPNVLFSGLSKPNIQIDNMAIEFKTLTSNKMHPIDYFIENLDYVTRIMDTVQDQIEKLGSKFIMYEQINKTNKKK